VPLASDRTVFDTVADGLGDIKELVAAYHHAAVAVAHDSSDAMLQKLGQLQHALDERDGWRLEQRVESVLSHLQLPPDQIVATLSGGWRRRVLLARALVSDPDLLRSTNRRTISTSRPSVAEQFLEEFRRGRIRDARSRVSQRRYASSSSIADGSIVAGDYQRSFARKTSGLPTGGAAGKFTMPGRRGSLASPGGQARRTRNEGVCAR
jgi:ATP-binding cassette subfamily F protein uup